MARVPLYDSPQVQRQALPGARIEEAPVGTASDIAARQGAQIQQGANQLIDTGHKIQMDMMEQANQLRVDDAVNQAKEQALKLTFDKDAGFTNLKGQAALQRPNGQSLGEEYGGNLQTGFSDIAASLGNDRQRQLFQQRTQPVMQQFQGQLMQHENQEFKTYAVSVDDGIQKNQINTIGLNYNNPAVVDDSIRSIQASVYRQGKTLGKSAEWIEAQSRTLTSNAHLVALQSALEKNDPLYADQYLKKYSTQMDANDILRANGLITKEVDAKIGWAAANQVMTLNAPRMAPTDADRLTSLVMGQESGGRRYAANGQLLTSSKGAEGEMQVVKGTQRDPGFGVRPADMSGTPKQQADEIARVGREYLTSMLQKYGGNVPQALAAYNAGPGAVDAALKKSESAGKEFPLAEERYKSAVDYANRLVKQHNANPTAESQRAVEAAKAEADALETKYKTAAAGSGWLTSLPKETQGYVSSIMAKYGSGGGAPARPTIEDVHQQVRATLGPNARPEQVRIATEQATKLFSDQTAATKQRQEEGYTNALSALIQNGGDFAALPNDVRAAIPPDKFDDAMAFAGKMGRKEHVATNWDLYYSLKKDPQVLGQVNLGALRDKLGDSEFKQLVNEQQDIRSGKTEDMTHLRNGKDVLNQMMREAGIDPTPKDTDKDGAATVGRIWNAFEARVREREQRTSKKLSVDEMKAEAAHLFTAVEVDRPWLWNKNAVSGAVAPGQRVVVPQTEVKMITDALKARGLPVTDDAIQNLYRRKIGAPTANNG